METPVKFSYLDDEMQHSGSTVVLETSLILIGSVSIGILSTVLILTAFLCTYSLKKQKRKRFRAFKARNRAYFKMLKSYAMSNTSQNILSEQLNNKDTMNSRQDVTRRAKFVRKKPRFLKMFSPSQT